MDARQTGARSHPVDQCAGIRCIAATFQRIDAGTDLILADAGQKTQPADIDSQNRNIAVFDQGDRIQQRTIAAQAEHVVCILQCLLI